ncbi:MAG: glycoside hydrolase 43 family protein [Bacteroidales bacterium]|nr:MAG: glycoside hydrolase 43 family protein [Bacteroidales bacterium]
MFIRLITGFIILIFTGFITFSQVWDPDLGNGYYKNPVIFADYSDPDVIRVGDDFYLTSSSFNCVPGLPVLHSKDLVNWKIIGHAFNLQPPFEVFDKPQHGNGCWAPAIRYHNGEFYIYYGDPDFGIYMTKSRDPAGPWDPLLLVKEAKGWIDPCPFWDDDGNAYLVHAFAGSRSGIKSVLVINRMNPEGTKLLDDGVLVFDGHDNHRTIEGPKMYKRNGYYYIFAPAGGVTYGWQTVLRSKNIYGPYEIRTVMDQGTTDINGPHQGAWIELASGESWFMHFQDREAYGRIVHLQPMVWKDDWPVIGSDNDGDGKGEPVLTYRKPDVGKSWPKISPRVSDEFENNILGLQWQWHANNKPAWAFPFPGKGFLRLYCIPLPENYNNMWDMPNLLMQKFPAPEFTATVKLTFNSRLKGDKCGLIIMGTDYAALIVENTGEHLAISQSVCIDASTQGREEETAGKKIENNTIYMRVKVSGEAQCDFYYSTDGENYLPVGNTFVAKPGRWIGAKMGVFSAGEGVTNDSGFADIDWFRVE